MLGTNIVLCGARHGWDKCYKVTSGKTEIAATMSVDRKNILISKSKLAGLKVVNSHLCAPTENNHNGDHRNAHKLKGKRTLWFLLSVLTHSKSLKAASKFIFLTVPIIERNM